VEAVMKFNMFSIGLIPLLAIGFNLALSKPSYAWLEVCNDHGQTIYFSAAATYAGRDGHLATWGTWELPPNDCWRTLNNDLDDFSSGGFGNFIYYYANDSSDREWKGDRTYCVYAGSREVRELPFRPGFETSIQTLMEKTCDLVGGKMVQMRQIRTGAKNYYLHLR